MSKESGGFGSGAIQMKAASAGAIAVAAKEQDGKANHNPDSAKDSKVLAGDTSFW